MQKENRYGGFLRIDKPDLEDVHYFKTGDLCPCCGQEITITDTGELWDFNLLVFTMGLSMTEKQYTEYVTEHT